MEKFVHKLKKDFPSLSFQEGSVASWSPRKRQIAYSVSAADHQVDIWSVLHELGHALLGHEDYESDIGLLQKEADAWERAIKLAAQYNLAINPDHIQNCLDTYRDWLHKRSTCPDCNSHGLQQNKALYRCLNCQTTWKVTNARFCRPYRLKKALAA
jgi:hypothetical protein